MGAIKQSPPAAAVAIAASAGGVDAIRAFVAELPSDFRAAVLIVLHIPPAGPSVLPAILSRVSRLPAVHPADGEALQAGVVYVAPPDQHMFVSDAQVRVVSGPRENGHRPAADVLLRSVAEHFGPRSAGVVLSGTMDDGAAGLRAVRTVGGFALVQDPAEAAFPGMPLAAIDEANPHVVGGVGVLAEHLRKWVTELPDISSKSDVPDLTDDPPRSGSLTPLTCPECGGTLWQHVDYGAERFRCRVGHTYSADGLMVGKQAALESALWAAIVALEERADVSRRIVQRLNITGRASQLERYRTEISESEKRARVLRDLMNDLVQGVSMSHNEEIRGNAAS
jgi:two-component system chemotaxis response regulator CheB